MTVKELQEKLSYVKDTENEVVFLVGERIVPLVLMAEVVFNGEETHFPLLGENANALAIKTEIVN
jgi:hypothetical protein